MSADPHDAAWTDGRPPLAWLALANRHALVTRVLTTTVHDVNNTLQVVSGAAEVLAMDPTPEAVVKRTDSIVAHARQATTALQALTVFARDPSTPSGRGRVKAAADQAVALRGHALRKARIACSVSGDEGECEAPAGVVLQVLLNLLVNAEAALTGRPGAELAVRVRTIGTRTEVTVEDNGGGVPEARVEALFVWPPWSPASGALGLGLLVSQALAKEHGGSLDYADTPGGGATFTLALPR
ncbi:MAG: HAMP domain-containing sensor histidine kinase [Acidobacteriota bacterium]